MMLQEKKMLSFHKLFAALDKKDEDYEYSIAISKNKNTTKNAIERHMGGFQTIENMNGIKRIQLCRQGLEALDRRGWNRSFHQRMFHEEYLKSCTRVFFKRDGPGAFSRSHSRVLEVNGWDSTPQEILVSTPRCDDINIFFLKINTMKNNNDIMIIIITGASEKLFQYLCLQRL